MAANVRGKENRIRMGTHPRPEAAPQQSAPLPSCRLLTATKVPYPVPAPRWHFFACSARILREFLLILVIFAGKALLRVERRWKGSWRRRKSRRRRSPRCSSCGPSRRPQRSRPQAPAATPPTKSRPQSPRSCRSRALAQGVFTFTHWLICILITHKDLINLLELSDLRTFEKIAYQQ